MSTDIGEWQKLIEKLQAEILSISKHLRPIPSQSIENSLRNRHLNMKNEKSENFKMLRNGNLNIFFFPKKNPFTHHVPTRAVSRRVRQNSQKIEKQFFIPRDRVHVQYIPLRDEHTCPSISATARRPLGRHPLKCIAIRPTQPFQSRL